MKQARLVIISFLILSGLYASVFAQQAAPAPTPAPRGYALEVTYFKGRPMAYLRLGEWAWYGAFDLAKDWKEKMGEPLVGAVKIYTRDADGGIKVKVTLLRGRNFDVEDTVGEYLVTDKKMPISELSNFGIVPFELRVVRAPTTVAELPAIVNKTKSLVVRVEPSVSSLPTFRTAFVNSSTKPVAALAYRTSIGDVTKLSGMPQSRDGSNLIAPGETYDLVLRYPMAPATESTGEVPPAQAGLTLNVLAVMFADGTYEGDKVSAERFRGYKLGEKIVLTRLLTVLRSPAAESPNALAAKLEEMRANVTRGDVIQISKEFPGISDGEIEMVRDAAEVAASGIRKDFLGTFGRGSQIDPKVFADAVKAAILKCDTWLNSIP